MRGFQTYEIVRNALSVKVHAITDILERWIISHINGIDIDKKQYNKECAMYKIRYDFDIPEFDDEFDNIHYSYDSNYVTFEYEDLMYKVELTERMKELFANPIFKERDIIELIYNYSTLMTGLNALDNVRSFGGQQWCFFDFDRIIAKHGINCEAFASPLNTFYSPMTCDFKYYSLFPSDSKFGSLGSFLETDAVPGNYEVNPPFIESILELAAKKCIEILKLGGSLIYFVGPAWRDAKFIEILQKSKFHVETKENRDQYKLSGKTIKSKAISYNVLLRS